MKWLIMRGARFYDIMGILLLALSVESLMNGISRIKNSSLCSSLCFVATMLWFFAGWFALEVTHVLQVYEEECTRKGIFDDNEVWRQMVEHQEHKQTANKVALAFILSLLAIAALIAANLLTKS